MHYVAQDTLVYIRFFEPSYIEYYFNNLSQAVCSVLHIVSADQEQDYLLNELEQQRKGNTLIFALFSHAHHFLGIIMIRSSEKSRGQLYCWIHERWWNFGYFGQGMQLAQQEYFSLTNDFFFTAHVDVSNVRSYYALKKNGFADLGICQGPYGLQYELIMRKK